MRSKSSKVILFLSDVHVGSYYAVCSEEPIIQQPDAVWKPTKLQKDLLSFWYWVKDRLSTNPYLICINGEPIDGDNPKEVGSGLWSTDVNDQLTDFAKLLKIYNPKHITMTRGSGYHVRKGNTSYEDTLAKLLKVTPYESSKTASKHKLWNQSRHEQLVIDDTITFRIKPSGVVFNAAHHVGYNRAFHNKTQAITAMLAECEFMRGKYWSDKDFPSVFARAHVHYFTMVRFARVQAFTQPTFKMSMGNWFSKEGVPQPPSIGAVEVIVEPNGHIIVEPHIITNDMYPKYEILEF